MEGDIDWRYLEIGKQERDREIHAQRVAETKDGDDTIAHPAKAYRTRFGRAGAESAGPPRYHLSLENTQAGMQWRGTPRRESPLSPTPCGTVQGQAQAQVRVQVQLLLRLRLQLRLRLRLWLGIHQRGVQSEGGAVDGGSIM